jgi:hypothetical protein
MQHMETKIHLQVARFGQQIFAVLPFSNRALQSAVEKKKEEEQSVQL